MNWPLLWKVFVGICKVFRFFTHLTPKRGMFLVVEDDPDDAFIIKRLLKKRGWECEIATSGEVAQGLVAHSFYSVAFVDMRLPGMSGEALVRILSRDTPNTSIVICCGEPSDLKTIPDGQLFLVIKKPPTLESIEDALNKLKL